MAYPDSILREVNKPARYTGGEWNSICKEWEADLVKVALCYPDVYEIGMPNMALPILYEIINSRKDALAERVFTPWADMATALRQAKLPLLSLESQQPLKDFDIIGFTLGYELTYTNVLETLDLAGVPVLAAERGEDLPLVIAGGSVALNPEPMSDFFDACIIGDGEAVMPLILDCFLSWKKAGGSKKELLKKLAGISGVYVPSLYEVTYDEAGVVINVTPAAGMPPTVKQGILEELPPPVTRPVIPYIEVTQDRGAVEISRGCTRGCRFCHAGTIYRPVRERPPEEVVDAIGQIIDNCGYDEVSLVSLSTSDYTNIEKLVASITQKYGDRNLSISLPSLRISPASVKLINSLPQRRKSGLTFAPEAGSRRLQNVINKVTTEEDLMDMANAAIDSGWTTLKLYFMLGLPTETMEDVDEIAALINRVNALGRKAPRRRPQIRVSLATFVPKPHTPFQWVAQDEEDVLAAKFERLKQGLPRRGIKLSWQEPKTSLLEAVLARGDRRLGKVIYKAWQNGATFDAWSERFSWEKWQKAFDEANLKPAFYAHRQRPLDEKLPWSHIETGVATTYLEAEYQRAIKGQPTADCRYEACNLCGLEEEMPQCQQKSAGA